jgi:Flp pilus assembly protein TadD
MADFDAAIRLKPDFARSYADRAALKETLGDDEGARADREKAKALDPLIDVRPFSGARSPTND